jgi:hypothetical protein
MQNAMASVHPISLRHPGPRCIWSVSLTALLLAPAAGSAQDPERLRLPLPLDIAASVQGLNQRAPIGFSSDGLWLAHTVTTHDRVPRDSITSDYTPTGVSLAEGDARMEARITRRETGESLLLGSSTSSSWAPVWSPDGARVAFYSDAGGDAGLWVWERETRTATRIPEVIVRPFFGQETLLEIPRLTGLVELDGRIDEVAWSAVPAVRLIAHAPRHGGDPDEPTEVRIAHDGTHLYLAARMYDSEPDRIQHASLRRDYALLTDWIVIVLDTFDDRETGVVFATTPTGLRTDGEITDDAQESPNWHWDTYWDVAVQEDREGWSAEFRIPFSSLGFQTEDGRTVMGVSFWRSVGRTREVGTWPDRPPRWGFNSVFKPSLTARMALEGVESSRPLNVVPYVLGGGDRVYDLDDTAGAFAPVDSRTAEVGLDLRYRLTSNLVVDLTVNPDFAQVEADEQEVNLTRFSLFFPERRRFFQERSSAFEFSLGGSDRLFHSRGIGLVGGAPVRIWGGGRIVGRIGEWDVAALTLQTAESEFVGGENFGVVRMRRRVLNPESYAGAMVTTRLAPEGRYNVVYGLDANLRIAGQDYLTLNWAQSFDADGADAGSLNGAFGRARWERRGTEGFGYAFDLSRAGSDFDPGIGFLLRSDYTRFGERLYYGWRPGDGSRIFRHTLSLEGAAYRRNVDGSLETAAIGPEWATETRAGHTLTVGGEAAYEDLQDRFVLASEIEVPPGSYQFHTARVSYGTPWGRDLRTTANLAGGTFFDGHRRSLALAPTWRQSQHLELGGRYTFDRVAFPDRNARLDAHIVRIRGDVMVSTRLSSAAFVQYNSAQNAVTANARVRFNPREGRDLYVVYNHGLNTDRHRLGPVLPRTDRATLLVKYSHALTVER